jgi:hypothetical protein
MAGPSLGINLSSITDWSTSYAFLNLFQTSRPWFTQSDGTWDTGQAGMLDLDAQGWVRGMTQSGEPAPFDRVSTILFTAEDGPRPGVYVLDWQGEGTLDLGLIAQEDILSRDGNRITLRIDGDGPITINISDTDPNGTGNYIRDIRLYHQDHAELIDAGRIFNPDMLARLDDFRVLRFMDWGRTNNSDVISWDETAPFDAARQSGENGVSLAMMVALANETRTDAWICIPHLADDAYIRAAAEYVRANLDPGLQVRFELSNEVWNWGFEQAQYARETAEVLWGDDAPGDVSGGWMQWYGMRAADMARIVADVFGSETGTRALNVFSTQAGWTGLEQYALDAEAHVAAGGTAPRDAPFHVYAIAPYFDGGLSSEDMAAQVKTWSEMGEAGFVAAIDQIRNGDEYGTLATIGEVIAYHAVVADGLGWQLEAYEGGQHIVQAGAIFNGVNDPAVSAWMVALTQRPEFTALYTEYLEIWRDNGGGMMAHFSDFGRGGQHGSWGVWDSVTSPDSPRAAALVAFNADVAAWWDDARPTSTWDNGVTLVDHDGRDRLVGTALDDALSGLDGNNSLSGRAGDDLIFARNGADSLMGDDGDDILRAGSGADTLRGGDGDDRMDAGSGADLLRGGQGQDTMIGGTGADRFIFVTSSSTQMGDGDIITDFTRGSDKIDLAGIDANTTRSGNEAFTFIGTASYSGKAGELRVVVEADGVRLRADVNGDGRSDLSIILNGVTTLTAADLIL